ncbi:putative mediator of RNA polymerase II transcription subunit 29 isoform X2 [Octopus bimaculoides]|uniref:putative mediator of RNA polymerase II transcription subunit 29 isoform X2 n=1 Tax=Octopus bimaculoides TaxID=37653 RepID=UPI0022E3A495|nr:putative mediator of RNA polymerase II transcription subunit 29 isoform X2 [Octopus bimaculoides]
MRDHIKIEITDATEMVPMSNNDGVTNKTNVDANGQCPENGGPPPLLNNDFTCAVNDNYRPVSPTDTEPTNGPIVEDVYDIPENLRRKTQQQQQRRQEQQQKELQQQQQQPTSNENIDDGETKKLVPPPVFRLDDLEDIKYIDDSEDDLLFPYQSDEEDHGNQESDYEEDDNGGFNERRKLLKTNSGGFTATFLLN